jgi:pimeloyl-ACP methyl ester carboxylesterase
MDGYRHEGSDGITTTYPVRIPSGKSIVHADLTIPIAPRGIVVFAHGSGSSRMSHRNRWVASELQWGREATLLVDLLTPDEAARDEQTGELRFDIQLLARRVTDVIDWVAREPAIRSRPLGLFGASTGAAAALFAAARRPDRVKAVVSRGGRPDLAESVLSLVEAPTLLIVGENDPDVLSLNQRALSELTCERRLEIIPGASHLFEEPGTLEAVAAIARRWFIRHLDGSEVNETVGLGL